MTLKLAGPSHLLSFSIVIIYAMSSMKTRREKLLSGFGLTTWILVRSFITLLILTWLVLIFSHLSTLFPNSLVHWNIQYIIKEHKTCCYTRGNKGLHRSINICCCRSLNKQVNQNKQIKVQIIKKKRSWNVFDPSSISIWFIWDICHS